MEPWSIYLTGTKSEILAALAKTPCPINGAVSSIFDLLDERPGFTDPIDPMDAFEADLLANPSHYDGMALAQRPTKRREEYITSHWELKTGGNPAAHGTLEIRIDPVYTTGRMR